MLSTRVDLAYGRCSIHGHTAAAEVTKMMSPPTPARSIPRMPRAAIRSDPVNLVPTSRAMSLRAEVLERPVMRGWPRC